MSAAGRPVVLLDVDNTLLDNDRVKRDLGERIEEIHGSAAQALYWRIYEELRTERGFADYLGALRRLAETTRDPGACESLTAFLLDYPFEERLYPHALGVIRYLDNWALPVIVSDGDCVYQPRKIDRSGLWEAVEGRVHVYTHKEEMLDQVDLRYPASRYAMVDDKLRLLAVMKASRGERLTTVFVRQGHYAHDAATIAAFPRADLTLERIGDLPDADLPARLRDA
jgi:FMN phosphatase YigB (HAD superfamily)